MDKQAFLFCSILCSVFAFSTPVFGDVLDQKAAEQLLKGNTAEGVQPKYKRAFKIYFDPSGTYRRLDDLNNRESGSWNVDKRGYLCMSLVSGTEKCRSIESIGDGAYILKYEGKKSHKLKKIIPGNPNNL